MSEQSGRSRASSAERAKKFFGIASPRLLEKAKEKLARRSRSKRSEEDMQDEYSEEMSWTYSKELEAMEKRIADQGYEELGSQSSSEERLEVEDPTLDKRYAFRGIGDRIFRQYVVGLNRGRDGQFTYQLFTGDGTIRHLKMREVTRKAIQEFLAEMQLKEVGFPEEESRVLADPDNPRFTELTICGDPNCEACRVPSEGDGFCRVIQPEQGASGANWEPGTSGANWEPKYSTSEDERRDPERRSTVKKDKKGGKKSAPRPLPPTPVDEREKHKGEKEKGKEKRGKGRRTLQDYELAEADRKLIAELVKMEFEKEKRNREKKSRERKSQKSQKEASLEPWEKELLRPGRFKKKLPSSSSSEESEEEENQGYNRGRGPRKKQEEANWQEEQLEYQKEDKRIYSVTRSQEYEQEQGEFPTSPFWEGVLKEVYDTLGSIPRATKHNIGLVRTKSYRIITSLRDLQSGTSADVLKRLHKAGVILVLNGVAHRLLPTLFVESCLREQDRVLAESCSADWEYQPIERLIEFLEKRILKAGGEQMQRMKANEYIQTEFQKKIVDVNHIASMLKTDTAHKMCASMAGWSELPSRIKKDRIESTARQLFLDGLRTHKPQVYQQAMMMSLLESPDVLKIAERIQNLFLIRDSESVNALRFDRIDRQLEDVTKKLEVNTNRAQGGDSRGGPRRGGRRGTKTRGRGGRLQDGNGTNQGDNQSQLALGYQGQGLQEACFGCGGNHRPRDCEVLRGNKCCFGCGSGDHFAAMCPKRAQGAQTRARGTGRGNFGGRSFRGFNPCVACKQQNLSAEECKAKSIHCFRCGGPYPCKEHSKPA